MRAKSKRKKQIAIKDRRRAVPCPNCGQPMICINRFASVDTGKGRSSYMWFVCPRRKGEKGCGQSSLMEISSGKKRPTKVVCSVQFQTISTAKKIKYRKS